MRCGTSITAFFAAIDPGTGKVEYSNGGHNPPGLRRADGGIESTDQQRTIPIGIVKDLVGEGGSFDLPLGDALAVYTDGIVGAPGPAR